MTTNNLTSYVSYDFDALRNEALRRLRANPAWLDTYEDGTGMMLIELLAFVVNHPLYYVERRTEEGFIATAQLLSSVINNVRVVNYTPKRITSASGSLQFTVATAGTEFVIPKHTECQTTNGIKFVTVEDLAFSATDTVKSVKAVEGEAVVVSAVGDGTANREIRINDTAVDDDSRVEFKTFEVLVTSGGEAVPWSKKSSFIDSGQSATDYVLRAELDGTVTVVFGDGLHGQLIPIGAEIQITYIRSSGSTANVSQTDYVTTINDTIYDSATGAVEITGLSVTNTTAMSGGDDAETIEQIRVNGPNVFSTGERFVTRGDYDALKASKVVSIADINAWGENEESSPNYSMFHRVKICAICDGWRDLTDNDKYNLTQSLYKQAELTDMYEFVTAAQINVIVSLDVLVKEGQSLIQARSDIESVMQSNFVLGSTATLGASKYRSNLIRDIDNISAVKYHHMTLKVRKELAYSGTSLGDWTATLDLLNVKASSVKIYVNTASASDVLIGTDDGAGNITDASSTFTVSGTVNYTTGALSVSAEPAVDIVSMYAVYEQDEEGDLILDNNQICRLYNNTIEMNSIGY